MSFWSKPLTLPLTITIMGRRCSSSELPGQHVTRPAFALGRPRWCPGVGSTPPTSAVFGPLKFAPTLILAFLPAGVTRNAAEGDTVVKPRKKVSGEAVTVVLDVVGLGQRSTRRLDQVVELFEEHRLLLRGQGT